MLTQRDGRNIRIQDVAPWSRRPNPMGDVLIQADPACWSSAEHTARTRWTSRTRSKGPRRDETTFEAEGITVYRVHRRHFRRNLAPSHSTIALHRCVARHGCARAVPHEQADAFISLTAIRSRCSSRHHLDRFGQTLNTITSAGWPLRSAKLSTTPSSTSRTSSASAREFARLAAQRAWRSCSTQRSKFAAPSSTPRSSWCSCLCPYHDDRPSGPPLRTARIRVYPRDSRVAARGLTVTPALCAVLLPACTARREPHCCGTSRTPPAFAERHHGVAQTVIAASVLLVADDRACAGFGGEFCRSSRGTSCVRCPRCRHVAAGDDGIGQRMSADLLRHPDIATVEMQAAGRTREDPGPPPLEFTLSSNRSAAATEAVHHDIREILGAIPASNRKVLTFLGIASRNDLRRGRRRSSWTSTAKTRVLDAKAREVAHVLTRERRRRRARGVPPGYLKSRSGCTKTGSRSSASAVGMLDAIETAYKGTAVAQVYEATAFSTGG